VLEIPSAPSGEYRLISANPALERLAGQSADGLAGRPVQEVFPGWGRALLKICRSVAHSGELVCGVAADPDGTHEFRVTVYCPAPGRLACLIEDPAGCRQSS
jgi:hypothetical protein